MAAGAVTKIAGRELASWLAVVAAVAQVATAYGLDVDGHVQGIVTAIIVFVFGVVTAIAAHDGIVATVNGVLAALFALFVAFGLEVSAQDQALWYNAATVLLTFFFVRPNVGAPVGPEVSPSGKLVA